MTVPHTIEKRKLLDVRGQVPTCDSSFGEERECIKNVLLEIFCLFSLPNVLGFVGGECVYKCVSMLGKKLQSY